MVDAGGPPFERCGAAQIDPSGDRHLRRAESMAKRKNDISVRRQKTSRPSHPVVQWCHLHRLHLPAPLGSPASLWAGLEASLQQEAATACWWEHCELSIPAKRAASCHTRESFGPQRRRRRGPFHASGRLRCCWAAPALAEEMWAPDKVVVFAAGQFCIREPGLELNIERRWLHFSRDSATKQTTNEVI